MGFKCGILSLIILLFIPGSVGENISVFCNPQTICALQESEVNLTCSFSNTNIRTVFWFNSKQKDKWKNEEHPEDLTLHSDCAERVTTKTTSSNSTLTIRDLREGDSGDYRLMIITDDGVKHHSSPAVRLTVTALQVKTFFTTQTQKRLTCSTSCSLTSEPNSYIWYKNGGQVFGIPENLKSLLFSILTDDSYSCSVSTHKEIRSSAVCVSNKNCWNVIYTNRRVCVLEGSSVEFPCSYSYPSTLTVSEVFWHYMWFETKPNDLREDEQFAGRVEFIGDKERNCTLRIRDVRTTDSGEYYFRINGSKGERFSGNPGVTLKVTAQENSSLLTIVGSLVVILALILIAAAVWIWWKRSKAQSGKCDSSHVNDNALNPAVTTKPSPREASEDQDTVQYSSVRFKISPNPTTYTLPVDAPEEQGVEYAAVNFSKSPADP